MFEEPRVGEQLPRPPRPAPGGNPWATSADASWRTAEGIGFRDTAGVVWQVVERDTRHVPGARAARCLVFTSECVVRRVWRYPADWDRLTPAALEALTARP